MYLYKCPQLLLKKNIPQWRFLLHLSLPASCTRASVFPQFEAKQCFQSNPNKCTLLSTLKWTLEQFSLHTICSSAKVSLAFWLFLLMRGLVITESAFSTSSLKCPVTDPHPFQHWTRKQFQLQCWTHSPLRVSTLSCPRTFVADLELILHWLKVHPFGLHLDHRLSQGLSYLRAPRHLSEHWRNDAS